MTVFLEDHVYEITVRMKHELDPDPWSCVFGVIPEELGDGEEAKNALDAFQLAWENNMAGVVSSQVQFFEYQMRIGDSANPTGPWRQETRSSSTHGGNGSEMLPQNCAAMFKKNTNTAGRQGRGRFFLPACLPEGQVTATGVLSAGIINSLQTAVTGFNVALGDPGTGHSQAFEMVVLHQAGLPDQAPSPVNSIYVDPTVSTQRRRLR